MKSHSRLPRAASAIFEHDLDISLSSTDEQPQYHRTDWKDMKLPRRPSLGDDESFFKAISSCNLGKGEIKRNQIFEAISRATNNVSNSEEFRPGTEEKDEAAFEKVNKTTTKKKKKRIALRIRKLEIELVQRRLPRFPSETHLCEPSFYPLPSRCLRKKQERIEKSTPHKKQDRKKKISSTSKTKSSTSKKKSAESKKKPSLPKKKERKKKLSQPEELLSLDSTCTTVGESESFVAEGDRDSPTARNDTMGITEERENVLCSSTKEIEHGCSQAESNHHDPEMKENSQTDCTIEKDLIKAIPEDNDLQEWKEFFLSLQKQEVNTSKNVLPDMLENNETACTGNKDTTEKVPKPNDLQEKKKVLFPLHIDEVDTSAIDFGNQCLHHQTNYDLPDIQESSETECSGETDLVEISSVETEDRSTLYIQDEFSDREFEEGKRRLSSVKLEENSTTSTIEIEEYSEYEVESNEDYYDESYYSEDGSEDFSEQDMEVDAIFEDLLQEMKAIQAKNIEQINQQLSNSGLIIEEISEGSLSLAGISEGSLSLAGISEESVNDSIEEIVDESMNESTYASSSSYLCDGSSSSCVYESLSSSMAITTHLTVEEEPYKLKIGVVAPEVRAMVIQARLELRCRKVPEEHIQNFKPALSQAALVARAIRLKEYIVEAWGRNYAKYDSLVLPSHAWMKGEETVSLPKLIDPTRPQFKIFKEAVALGGIKALKPKITTNYDIFNPTENYYDEEVDIDDVTRHKRIRTKYLTDKYLHQEYAERERFDEDEDAEPVHYASLDDVELPTNCCPVFVRSNNTMSDQELRDSLAQQVAEAVWDRRYRLERPLARQRIKYRCTCKYCKNSSPYQTLAYRKRWLVKQNLWKDPTVIETIKESIKDNGSKQTSNRTASTRKSSIGENSNFDPQMVSEYEVTKISDDLSVDTIGSSDIPQSLSSEGEEFFECAEHEISVMLETDEDRSESEKSSVDIAKLRILRETPKCISDKDKDSDVELQPMTLPGFSSSLVVTASGKEGQKAKKKKRFMSELQSALGIIQHGKRPSKSMREDRNKKSEKDKKVTDKNKRSLKNGIKSLFGNSVNQKGTRLQS